MKKQMALLAGVACIGIASLQGGDGVLRTDLFGGASEGKTAIEAVNEAGDGRMKLGRPGWLAGKPEGEFHLYGEAKAVDAAGAFSFTFRAASAGVVVVKLGGGWSREAAARQPILIDRVLLNGELMPNGDFKNVWKDKTGRKMAAGFWADGEPAAVDGAAAGMHSIRVDYGNRLCFTLQVKAGELYTVTVFP